MVESKSFQVSFRDFERADFLNLNLSALLLVACWDMTQVSTTPFLQNTPLFGNEKERYKMKERKTERERKEERERVRPIRGIYKEGKSTIEISDRRLLFSPLRYVSLAFSVGL